MFRQSTCFAISKPVCVTKPKCRQLKFVLCTKIKCRIFNITYCVNAQYGDFTALLPSTHEFFYGLRRLSYLIIDCIICLEKYFRHTAYSSTQAEFHNNFLFITTFFILLGLTAFLLMTAVLSCYVILGLFLTLVNIIIYTQLQVGNRLFCIMKTMNNYCSVFILFLCSYLISY